MDSYIKNILVTEQLSLYQNKMTQGINKAQELSSIIKDYGKVMIHSEIPDSFKSNLRHIYYENHYENIDITDIKTAFIFIPIDGKENDSKFKLIKDILSKLETDMTVMQEEPEDRPQFYYKISLKSYGELISTVQWLDERDESVLETFYHFTYKLIKIIDDIIKYDNDIENIIIELGKTLDND